MMDSLHLRLSAICSNIASQSRCHFFPPSVPCTPAFVCRRAGSSTSAKLVHPFFFSRNDGADSGEVWNEHFKDLCEVPDEKIKISKRDLQKDFQPTSTRLPLPAEVFFTIVGVFCLVCYALICCIHKCRGMIDPNDWAMLTELLQKLKRYGVAGVLSYGLLNTVYYVTTFLCVWFYFVPAPSRMGYAAAVKRFFQIVAMVWAGSQVTKILRAGGALALAPLVDRWLSWFTIKFQFESEGKAFAAIAGLCFGLALLLFLGLTLLCA